MNNKVIDKKLLRFIFVGIINTVAGSLIMFGLYNIGGCSYWISSAANYIIVSIMSFFLNKYFTFGHKGKIGESALKFAINIAVCYLIAYGIARPLMVAVLSGSSQTVQENVAMLTGMCLFVGLNYLGQRFFAFRQVGER